MNKKYHVKFQIALLNRSQDMAIAIFVLLWENGKNRWSKKNALIDLVFFLIMVTNGNYSLSKFQGPPLIFYFKNQEESVKNCDVATLEAHAYNDTRERIIICVRLHRKIARRCQFSKRRTIHFAPDSPPPNETGERP